MAVQPDLSKTWSETKLLVLSRDDSVLLRIGKQVLVFRPNVSYFLFINVYRSEGTTESKGVRGPFVNAPTAIAHTHTHTYTHTHTHTNTFRHFAVDACLSLPRTY